MIVLGIDSGTQSTKTIALDLDGGTILATAQKGYDLLPGLPPGNLEQHPDVWIDAVKSTMQEVLSSLGEKKAHLTAIGVSGQQHGLVVLNGKGEPIRPAKLWCDTSTTEECAELTRALGGQKEAIDAVGNAILPGYTAPKILWLKKREPAAYAETRTVLLPHDYINYWLTGEKRMEFGDASGTALFDVRQRDWSRKAVTAIGEELADKLPEVRSSTTSVGLLRDTLRQEFGLRESVLVSAGGGDNMMGAIGTGNVRPGIFTASLGTSGTLYAFSEKPMIDPEGEVAGFCDSTDHWLPLVCTMNVTVCTEQVRTLFSWSIEQFTEAVGEAKPGAEGLLFLPYLNGERTPNLPQGCGVFHGFTPNNMTPPNMARAVMEGVTLGLGYGFRRFVQLGLKPTEVRLTGGGSKSPVWRQVLADVFQCPVVCLSTSEGAALGAAIQASAARHRADGKGLSMESALARFVTLDETSRLSPDSGQVGLYQGLAERHTDLTRKLKTTGYL